MTIMDTCFTSPGFPEAGDQFARLLNHTTGGILKRAPVEFAGCQRISAAELRPHNPLPAIHSRILRFTISLKPFMAIPNML